MSSWLATRIILYVLVCVGTLNGTCLVSHLHSWQILIAVAGMYDMTCVVKVRTLIFCTVVRAFVEFDRWFYEAVFVGECVLQCSGG